MSRPDVVVVGAGLAGLACATTLHRAGRSVRVVEASDAVGGRVRTDAIDGFRVDRGFQVLLTAYPEAHRQLDLAALDLCRFQPGAIVHDGSNTSVVADPFRSPRQTWKTVVSPVGSLADKARIALLRRRVRAVHPSALLAGDDCTTLELLRREGFSERMIDRFFRPLVGGIQLDPSLTTSRRMFDVIFRMLADGDSAVPACGMQAIPDQLAATLPSGTIELGVTITSVNAGSVRTDAGTIDADFVVVATDGPAAGRLLGLPEVGSKPAAAVWFAADAAPSGDRMVHLDATGSPVCNVAIMSNVAPRYAPAGRHVIVAALPGVLDGELVDLARRTLRAWWGDAVGTWEVVTAQRIPHGQPRQTPPFSPKRSVALAPGLFVCGDHRDTASIQGALFSGRRCAEAILGGTTG
jgi:phytoene dehydrogenase-like protein